VNFVQAPGSIINVSGGYLTYTPGFVRVSTLINAYGQIVSAGSASPNMDYVGVCCSFVVDHTHWNVTDVYVDGPQPKR